MAISESLAVWGTVCTSLALHEAIPKGCAGQSELDLDPNGPQNNRRERKWEIPDKMLYLHIGGPKAGSTSIQRFLKDNQSVLPLKQLSSFGEKSAWKIGAASGTADAHWYWVEHTKQFNEQDFASLSSALWKEVADEVSMLGSSDFIASSEFIFLQLADDDAAIRRLRDRLLQNFSDVKIIVYLRDQVSFVKSMYSQLVRGPTKLSMSYSKFMAALSELDVARHYVPIHYDERLRLWVEAFGHQNLEPVVFHRDNFPNQDLLEDICARTGVAIDRSWQGVAARDENVSPPFSHINVFRILNGLGLKSGLPQYYAFRIVRDIVGREDFPKQFDEQIRKSVTPGNRHLNSTFFSESAVKLPEHP